MRVLDMTLPAEYHRLLKVLMRICIDENVH